MSDSSASSRELDCLLLKSSSSEESNSVDHDQEVINLLLAAAQDRAELAQQPKVPCQTSALRGYMYKQEIVAGSPVRFCDVCRMDRANVSSTHNCTPALFARYNTYYSCRTDDDVSLYCWKHRVNCTGC